MQVNKHLFSAASFAKLLVDSEIEFQSKLVLVFCVILLKRGSNNVLCIVRESSINRFKEFGYQMIDFGSSLARNLSLSRVYVFLFETFTLTILCKHLENSSA